MQDPRCIAACAHHALHLKELEEHCFVYKVIHPQVPPKVEYSLTDLGRSVVPAISALGEWANAHQGPLRAAITQRLGKALVRE